MIITDIETIYYPGRLWMSEDYNRLQTIIEQEKTLQDYFEHEGGEELFRYYNEVHYTEDNPFNNYGYCVITIKSHQSKSFLVELEAEYPDRLRKMKAKHDFADTYRKAREKALQFIDYAEKWLVSDWWLELPITAVDKETWDEHRDWLKKIMKDGTHVVRLIGDHNKRKFNIDPDREENRHNEYYRVVFE